jgi:hypothetical protein
VAKIELTTIIVHKLPEEAEAADLVAELEAESGEDRIVSK